MPSSWSLSLRFELQYTGENVNLWGDKLDTVLQHADYSIAGWLTKALTTDYTLTTANAGDDEARAAMLKFTGTGAFTVTIPSVSKAYHVWNACTGSLTLTTGAGGTVTLRAGEVCTLISDGSSVYRVQPTEFGSQRLTGLADPTGAQDAATKAYADALAFASFAGTFPVMSGNAGKVILTDGATAFWHQMVTADILGFAAGTSGVRTGTATDTALTPGDVYNALAEVTLTDAPGGTVAVDLSAMVNGTITFTGSANSRTLGNPASPKVGQTGFIRAVQSSGGSNSLSFASNWKRQGGAGALSSTANATDIIVYEVITSTYILYDVKVGPS
jgi:hypothetical protein